MEEKEKKSLNTYTLQGLCGKCGRLIEIDFSILFREKQRYGKKIGFQLETLPEYLNQALENIQYTFDLKRQNYKTSQPSPPTDPTAPVCRSCQVLENFGKDREEKEEVTSPAISGTTKSSSKTTSKHPYSP